MYVDLGLEAISLALFRDWGFNYLARNAIDVKGSVQFIEYCI